MSTAREGQPSGRNNPYETGGGGFGKLKKKPFRKSHQATPYARPPTAIRNPQNSGWLSKLVDPAQRFIAYSAHRLFDSFRKRLTAPVSPSPPSARPSPDVNHDARSSEHQQVISDHNILLGRQASGHNNPSTSSDHGDLTELEQILQQKTFTRSEIDHLTTLLHSRTDDRPMGNAVKRSELNSMKQMETYDRTGEFPKTPARENIGSYLASPFATNSQVVDGDSSSPAEIAKAYMGSVPSKVSPSMLGIRGQALRQDSAMLSGKPNISKSPIMALISSPKPSGRVGIAENGFVTPRSRGRTAIYNMARTPYPRLQSPASVKGAGTLTNVSYAPSSSQSVWEQSKLSGSRQEGQSLKRRSSFLDSDIGSAGPVRRIRQKSNLVPSKNLRLPVSGTPLSTHGSAITSERPSSSSQKPLYLGESSKRASAENGMETSGTSFPPVSSKTNEMASRILEQLDKLATPVEKSPSKLSPSMLRGPALKSLEKIDSSHVFENALGDSKKNDMASSSRGAQDTASRGKRKMEENNTTISQAPHGRSVPAANGVQTTNLSKNIVPEARIADSGVVKSALPPKRGFQMSAHEDYLDLDEDDDHSDGVTTTSLAEAKKENPKSVLMEKKSITFEPNTMEKEPVAPEGAGNSSISISNGKTVSFAFGGATSSSTMAQPQSTPISDGPTSVKESNMFPANSVNGEKDTLPKEQNPPVPSVSHSFKVADVAPQLTVTSSSSTVSESLGSKLTSSSETKVVSSSRFAPVATKTTDPVPEFTESDKTDVKNIPKDTPKPENTLSSVVSTPSPASGLFSFGNNSSLTNGSTSASISSFSAASNLVSNNITNGDKMTNTKISLSSAAVSPAVSDTRIFKLASSVVSPASTPPLSAPVSAEPTETKTKEVSFGNSTGNPFETTSENAKTSGIFGSTLANSTGNFGSGSTTFTDTGSSIFASTTSAITSTGSLFSGTTSSMPATGTSASISNNTSSIFGGTSSAISNTATNPFVSGPTAAGSGPGASIFSFGASAPTNESKDSAPSNSTDNSNGPGFPSSTQSIPVQFGSTTSSPSFGVTGSAPFSSANAYGDSSSSTANLFSSVSAMANPVSSVSNAGFDSNIQAPKSPVFTPFSSASTSPTFSFGVSSASSSASGGPAAVFGSTSSSSGFPFTSSAAPATPSQPMFGGNANNNITSPFSLSPRPTDNNNNNNDQMGMEDSMAEDTAQGPTVPVFGQNPSPSNFMFGSATPSGANPSSPFGSTAPSPANPFGSTAPSAANLFGSTAPSAANPFGGTAPSAANPFGSTAPSATNPFGSTAPSAANPFGSAAPAGANPSALFQFSGQQNPSPSSFQASSSLEFNAGGSSSFSLGSGGGGDKSGRRIVKLNRTNKNRRK